MISLRLKTILNLINNEKRLIDIGCDHGLVGIFALKEQRVKEVIASDINPKSLSAAKANILKYNVSNMKTLVSDGFDNIDLKEDDLVLISGMGFKTIEHIFNNDKSSIINNVIIQSNNDLYDLRKHMTKHFYIEDEKIVFEKGHYYVIIFFKKGIKKYKFIDLYLGPKIRFEEKEYVTFIYNHNKSLIDKIGNNNFIKKMKLSYINYLIKNQISYFNK